MIKPVYLDYNATTPIDPRVAEAMLPFIQQHFGNPSSSHYYGVTARKAVDRAREQVAAMLRCSPEEIIFTSGGTESNNHAIKGVAHAYRDKGNHIITSAVEHPAVTEVCRYLAEKGFAVTTVPVDDHGLVDPREVERAITPQTILITIMHANNEVGAIEPLEEIAAIAHRRGILVHTDAAQSIGKIPVEVDRLEVDLLSIAGHKLYAPKGVGALYVRQGIELEKLLHGANHEMNRRAGTENVIQIVGLGEACEIIRQNQAAYEKQMRKVRDSFEAALREKLSDVRLNGPPERRLPNTSNLSFKGIEANAVLAELQNVAASAGAACHSDHVAVSSVLKAMRVPLEYAMGAIRFSVGRFTTEQEIDKAVDEIVRVVQRQRRKATETG